MKTFVVTVVTPEGNLVNHEKSGTRYLIDEGRLTIMNEYEYVMTFALGSWFMVEAFND